MKRSSVFGAALLVGGASLFPSPAPAQVNAGADLGFFSAYVWRGISMTNKPVAQPDVYLTVPAGKASVGLGGWANIDLGRYDNVRRDLSESGGLSSLDLAEFDPWAEISYPIGRVTVTGGALGYVFPNDAGFTSALNTLELYGKVAFGVPLSPKLAAWYDVDKIKGLYAEASIAHTIQASDKVAVALGALAGFNAGQDASLDNTGTPTADFFNFADDGFTHLDLSAAVPFSAGPLSISPALHVVVAGDDLTKVTSPTDVNKDAKVWGGVTISWSRTLGEVAEEPAEGAQ